MARKIDADCGAGEENKMAESEVKELEVKERKRKPNFSPLEISVITESVKKHIDVIQTKLTNNITTKKKVKSGRRLPRSSSSVSSSRSISRCWNFLSRICGSIRGNSKSAILFVLTKFFPD